MDNIWSKTGFTLALKLGAQFLSFLLLVLLARLMSIENFGLYILIWSMVQILSVIALSGMDMGALRFLSKFDEEQNASQFKKFGDFGFRTILLSSLTIVCISFLILLAFKNDAVWPWSTLLIGLTITPFLAGIKYCQAISRVMGRFIMGLLPESILRPIIQIILIGLLYLALFELNALTALICALMASLCAFGIAYALLGKAKPHLIGTAYAERAERNEWLTYGAAMIFISTSAVILKQTDIIMVGMMAGAEDAGLYAAAARIANLATFALASVNMVIAPTISRLYQKHDKEALDKILAQAIIMIAFLTILIVLGLMLLAQPLLGIFGEPFIQSETALKILLAAQLVNALAGPAGYFMSMTGHHKQAAGIFLIAALSNIVLNSVLIPLYGINGAALATGFSIVIWNSAMVFFVITRLGYNPSIFRFFKFGDKNARA